MDIASLKTRLIILIRIEDISRAIYVLDKISIVCDNLNSELFEIIINLKSLIFKEYKKFLNKLKKLESQESLQVNKSIYKYVLDTNSEKIIKETINKYEQFIICLRNLKKKCSSTEILILLLKLEAKLFNELTKISTDNSKYHESALDCYTKAVRLAVDMLNITSEIRLKLFYSYIKFLRFACNDKYRSVLFCVNIITELNKLKDLSEYIMSIKDKLSNFYREHEKEYNETLRIFHPELLEE